jgi:peptide/nickel transport system substrate-binding protein
MRRVISGRLVAITVMILLLVGGPNYVRGQQSENLTFALGGLGTSMDFQIACDMVTWSVLKMVHDPLLYMDDNHQIKPSLATTWRQINPTTWQFKLRQGVKFHDGEPFNAAAVKFTLERYQNPRVCLRTTFTNISRVDVVDDYTVNVVLRTPDWTILNTLATWSEMLPPKAAADMDSFGARPVGTGPYIVQSWTPGDRIVLRRNEQYWAYKPRQQQITWRIIREDATRVAALKSGEVDFINNAPPEAVPDLQSSRGLKVHSVASVRLVSIGINMAKKTPFSELVKVRQALWYAIDRDTIVKSLLGGLGSPVIDYVVVPEIKYAIRTPLGYRYDPAKAKALLAEAGYPNGITNCTFAGPVGRYLKDKEVGQALGGQLAQIGINCKLVQLPIAEFLLEFRKGADSQFDFGFLSLAPQSMEINFALLILWADSPYTQYHNEQAYRMFVKARETQNENERKSLYAELQKVYAQEGPVIHIYRQPQIDATKASLPYRIRPDEQILLEDRYLINK